VNYSVVPTPIPEEFEIKPISESEHEFVIANGNTVVPKKGIALFKYGSSAYGVGDFA
jgi:hypothetical protein